MTINSARLAPIIDLPVSLRNREVEVIVLPKSEESKDRSSFSEQHNIMKRHANLDVVDSNVVSVKGILRHRANPELRNLEAGAWERAATEKYLEKNNRDRS